MIGHLTDIADYERYIGAEACDRILKKAKKFSDYHIAYMNSTYYGGGVAELLSSLILLFNSVGIKAGWRTIQGSPDFFNITKKMHNALQGGKINLSARKKKIYEEIVHENAIRNHLEHDIVVIHDPQPLPIIQHYKRRGPWFWRCHIDMTAPNPELWSYLTKFVERYDAVIFTLDEYKQDIKTPQLVFEPAIDPFTAKNRELSEEEMKDRLEHYNIPTDLPLVVQISRFDRAKDPEGVIKAFKKARKEVDATLILLGDIATDDPEGKTIYESLLGQAEERIIIVSHQDSALVNTLQKKAAVVVQKSVKEGFGLTVTEAMWKENVVIGGNVGGIRYQIDDGVNGFLVNSPDEAAERIVQVLKDDSMRREIGKKARESVRKKYLMSRYLENYLDLFGSIETFHRVRGYNKG